jgi:hypothetical protein
MWLRKSLFPDIYGNCMGADPIFTQNYRSLHQQILTLREQIYERKHALCIFSVFNLVFKWNKYKNTEEINTQLGLVTLYKLI